MHLADRQDPVTVGRGVEPAVVVDLSVGGGDREGPRHRGRGRVGAGRAVAEPDPLLGLVDIGKGADRPPGHEAHGTAAVLVDPAADAHPFRRMVGRSVRAGPYQDDAARLGGARLEPVEGIAVGAELGE